VIEATTTPKEMAPAYGARPGTALARAPARGSAIVAPPTAPERTPIREIPICTVERKRFGELASSSAERAPLSPASARCLRPAFRAETNAVSDMAKRPLRRIKRTTIALCNASRMVILGPFLLVPRRPQFRIGSDRAQRS
jgi:hypothetical protein